MKMHLVLKEQLLEFYHLNKVCSKTSQEISVLSFTASSSLCCPMSSFPTMPINVIMPLPHSWRLLLTGAFLSDKKHPLINTEGNKCVKLIQ